MFFNILFFIFVFIIIFGEFFYPKIVFLLPKKPVKKPEIIPEITILIPAYNEEKIIAQKIKNTLSLDYPKNKIEIVVIDNGSTDQTSQIASQFPIALLKSERGKINALNTGINYAKTDFIAMTDADVELSANSLISAVSCFGEGVGAVNGYVSATADGGDGLMKEKKIYKDKDWELRYQEGLLDSACNLDGKFIVFKKSIFSGFSKNAIVDDYSMTFDIRGKGYRLIIDKSAKIYEKLQENPSEEIKQFQRYAFSVLLINFKNIKFLFNPKYGYFGLLTFPFRRFFPVLYPIFMLYSAIFLLIVGVSEISKLDNFAAGLIFGAVVFVLLLVAIFLILYKRLMLVQLFAVLISYVYFLKKDNLKFGRWTTSRKK